MNETTKKLTKREKMTQELFDSGQVYEFHEAVTKLKDLSNKSKIKFVESLDLAVNLGVDARKGEQMIRGMLSLPFSSQKDVKIAVFADGQEAKIANKKGATIVGMEDLAESIKGGNLDFDVLIAVPEAMKLVGQLGKVLGPKGLMPNPKDGTVTKDIAGAIAVAKAGQVRIRNEKGGIVHCSIGKVDANLGDLEKNFIAIMNEIKRLKPKTAKGTYLKKITVSSTMGPGVQVNIPAA